MTANELIKRLEELPYKERLREMTVSMTRAGGTQLLRNDSTVQSFELKISDKKVNLDIDLWSRAKNQRRRNE